MHTQIKSQSAEKAKLLKQKKLADALKKNILRRKAQMQQRKTTVTSNQESNKA